MDDLFLQSLLPVSPASPPRREMEPIRLGWLAAELAVVGNRLLIDEGKVLGRGRVDTLPAVEAVTDSVGPMTLALLLLLPKNPNFEGGFIPLEAAACCCGCRAVVGLEASRRLVGLDGGAAAAFSISARAFEVLEEPNPKAFGFLLMIKDGSIAPLGGRWICDMLLVDTCFVLPTALTDVTGGTGS
jgi:hypothetical protein